MMEDLKQHNGHMEDLPHLCFVAHALGNTSEVWLWRQLFGFKNLSPHVITWEYVNRENFKIKEMPVNILGFPPRGAEVEGVGRWLYRLRNLYRFNFYGSLGAERLAIKNCLIRWKPKVMLCQTGHTALKMLPITRDLNIPLVAHFHGADVSSALQNRWYGWSLLCWLKKFSAIVVVGSHQKQWMLEHGIPENKIHLIPCGVPTCEFVYTNNKPKKDFVRFLAVSRLVEKKGLEYSIRAFSLVKEKLPSVKLDIFGEGPLENKLEEQVNSMGLSDSVGFMGSVSPDCIREEMALSDVFLQHSVVASSGDTEGFGVSIAEASASGLPLVCSNATGIIDQVIDGKTGFLVEQKDYKSMAERMLQLACDAELRQKMGQEGRKRMIEHFDTKEQITKLEDVLLNCIKH